MATDEGSAADGHRHQAGGPAECQLCPWCGVLRAVSAARPEISEHLVAAGRELALAWRALLDGYADGEQAATAAPRAGSAGANRDGEEGLRRIPLS